MRAKFSVRQITKYDHLTQTDVKLSPVYSDDPESENKKFWDATPSGELTMRINNPAAADFFELGREYYLDFTPVDG